MFGNRPGDYEPYFRWGGGSSDEDNGPDDSPNDTHYSQIPYSGSFSMEEKDKLIGNSRYCLVASKQMVGIYLTVWVKSDLRDDVRNMKVSCVGRGLMGYLGNKVQAFSFLQICVLFMEILIYCYIKLISGFDFH